MAEGIRALTCLASLMTLGPSPNVVVNICTPRILKAQWEAQAVETVKSSFGQLA